MKLLREEQEKAEDLLLNILPKDIADILKNEKRIIADNIEGASILFADVVNFTPLSAKLSPTELVGLLNDVFSYCDTLVEKYSVEKIKTIGDCYMIAAGVPKPRADHAAVLVRLALEFQNYIQQHTFNHGIRLQFRLGINSGPVVAGVIGRKKFIYDLWGDTVNTASRMESNGSGGFIQVTESTYALIKDHFVCEPRGVIHIKGKGDMPVWFVTSEKLTPR
jgi:guanylate cyclase